MKIRNWVLLITFVAMLIPFISTSLFVSFLTNWYDREEVSEYIHASIRINALASEIKNNHRLFKHSKIAEEVLNKIVAEDEIVHLYSKDLLHINSIHEEPLFTRFIPAKILMKGLYETKETMTYFIHKEPVFQNDELIGFFEIKKRRAELQKQLGLTSLYTFLFFLGSAAVTLLLTYFLVKRRISRPLAMMVGEMKTIAGGNFKLQRTTHHKEDEFYQLINGFYEMSQALHVAKQKEEKTQAMKQQLIAAISHDLRTPLTAIKAYAEGMKDHEGKEEEYREVIVRKANYMEKLINDLLLYSRLEMDEFKLNRQIVDGEELAEMLVEGYEEVHKQRDLQLKVTISVNPCQVDGDVSRLAQVMDNLVSNAIRYTPKGKMVELIATNVVDHVPGEIEFDERYLYFFVKNEGDGIAEEEQEKIFTLFYQVDEARKKENNAGAGLGLAISKNLIDRHNGKIGVYSRLNEGSIVYFALPMLVKQGEEK